MGARGVDRDLGKMIAEAMQRLRLLEILAGGGVQQGIAAARVTTPGSTGSNGSFIDLATPGPTVNVRVGPNKRLLVFPQCHMNTNPGEIGFMGFEISGATAVPASENYAVISQYQDLDPGALVVSGGNAGAFFVDGLNIGDHTLTAKYKSFGSAVTFYERHLIVIPF